MKKKFVAACLIMLVPVISFASINYKNTYCGNEKIFRKPQDKAATSALRQGFYVL